MSLPIEAWHARFVQQAGWSHSLRQHLLQQAALPENARVLEVGCGTGAVLAGLPSSFKAAGIDLDLARLHFAKRLIPGAGLCAADGLALPFPKATFDAACCHYLLLWVSDPGLALSEMRRVTRPGGWVFAFSEPDYGGRIDHPAALKSLGDAQAESLAAQRADPQLGRALPGLFAAAGLESVQWGVLGAERRIRPESVEIETEWAVLRADLEGRIQAGFLDDLEDVDRRAWASGERVLFIPTFYAAGRVPPQS